jgi:hypothetical protein
VVDLRGVEIGNSRVREPGIDKRGRRDEIDWGVT